MTLSNLNRRSFLGSLLAAPQIAKTNPNDIRIDSVTMEEESYLYRTPIKFGGTVVDRVTLLNVHVTVQNRAGKTAQGFGSMPLGNVWSFPSKTLTYEQTLAAMQSLAKEIRRITASCSEFGHPVELNHLMEPEWLKAAGNVGAEACDAGDVAVPFDAAVARRLRQAVRALDVPLLHTRVSCERTCDATWARSFKGDHLERYVLKEPKPRMPLYHLVGAVDPIVEADITKRVGDGLPETLPEWINYNGLTHIKIKLNGDNLEWDASAS